MKAEVLAEDCVPWGDIEDTLLKKAFRILEKRIICLLGSSSWYPAARGVPMSGTARDQIQAQW